MRAFRRIGAALGAALLGLTLLAPPAGAATVDLAGTVDVDGCSGSLVRMPATAPDDPALVLTNGHCYEGAWTVPDEVLVDQPSHRVLNLLDGAGKPVAALHAARAVYVTMTGTDIALYRLGVTYRQLERNHRVRPLTVSAARPTPGTDIRVASGSMKKVFSCELDALVYRVLETGYVTRDVLRYTKRCDTGPGTSGSPVIDATTGQVIGVNNTSNRTGGRCTMDDPCEMNRDGAIAVRKGTAYGTQTYWLTTCLGAGNRLDLNRPGCLLPRPDTR
ncbi:serine protease [Spongiactinospora sp. TRM90649]|uniref:S1 family peptidase n=1 Tax=Spongiactinospora sp. TRM90649 TaxID=3031114 RepID=UPI0023F64D16|nr:serine protease [Spongiactinospora sp. TRM90649]MDF5751244.1 serine protease [Spongiactinospora sp. TRM90649]